MSSQASQVVPDTARAASQLSLWSRLDALTGRINQRLDQIVSGEFGLSLSEFFTLRALLPEGQRGARVHDVAHSVGINASTMSRIASRLQGRGLIQRVTCDFDKRGVYCAITTDGQQLARDIETTLEPELASLLDEAALDIDAAVIVSRLRYAPR